MLTPQDLLKVKLLQFPGRTLFKLKIVPRRDDKLAQGAGPKN